MLSSRSSSACETPPADSPDQAAGGTSISRLHIHRRAGSGANGQRLLIDDLGQVTAAAGSIVLLAYGFWPGAILALAVLLWLGLSARRSTQSRRVAVAGLHSS